MREQILRRLAEAEEKEHILILHAVESGSRAWGFASSDSDYDVRFLYVRPAEAYLRLEKRRDVVEYPPDDILDINGWDLDKTLRLLHASNPTLFEWFRSPLVYRSTSFFDRMRAVIDRYFLMKSGLNHYLSMAKGNYREYLRADSVRLKKYFYAVRPLLACRWILERHTPPPMLFSELMECELKQAEIRDILLSMLEKKKFAPEMGLVPRIDSLNRFIETELDSVQAAVTSLPNEAKRDWEELDALFLEGLSYARQVKR